MAFHGIKINHENPVSKAILLVSKHEYGIYLFHLLFIKLACQLNPYIQELMTLNRRIIYIYLGCGALFIGILMSICIDGINWKERLKLTK